jgi:hypothetical protein
MATKSIKREKIRNEILRFPPFRILGTPKPENFPHFLDFARQFFLLKGMENFQVLGANFFKVCGRKRGGAKPENFLQKFSWKKVRA